MDGYSVSEAASVLGVPIERVWELLARGVLAGAPEGETGMRVFLHPRPASTPAAASLPPPTENGGTREPERELSPFRELLTEFRNLTERYGQALLALGESRGEVASLRSRVDLLEARMDLGLPAPGRVRASGAWGAPPYGQEQTVIPTTPPDAEAERPHETEEHHTRRRGPRRATESFAEALARAEDPSIPELPAAEVGDAAVRHEASEEPALPRELPAADMVPVAEEPGAQRAGAEASEAAEPPRSPAPEPDVAAQPEAAVEVEAEIAPAAEVEVAAEIAPAAEVEAEAEPEEATGSAEQEATPASSDETTEPSSLAAEGTEVAGAEAEGGDRAAEPVTWDTDRYTADIEEPDWYEAEADAPAAASGAEPEATATTDAPAEEDPSSVAPEETLLWLQADEPPAPTLPGSGELESALEALGATGPVRAESADVESERVTERPASEAAERPSPPPAVPPSALRYRPVAPTGPTGRAYRRLRRIFPD